MGANYFCETISGSSAKDAFNRAHDYALYEHGHNGYTGTIAEKFRFEMASDEILSSVDAEDLAESLRRDQDSFISDKWGPAGCIEVMPHFSDRKDLRRFLFFGYASS